MSELPLYVILPNCRGQATTLNPSRSEAVRVQRFRISGLVLRSTSVQGYLAHKKVTPSSDERGTPVGLEVDMLGVVVD